MRRCTGDGGSSDDEGDDPLVQLGTHLLDSLGSRGTKRHRPDPSALAREYVPEWQQEARDAQGCKRFHGAFTGGFSAGYFNTVGSKEGWTPQPFKSSRKAKAASMAADTAPGSSTRRSQRVEDFMDEEDLEDRRNQPVEIRASFQRRRSQKAKPVRRFDFSTYEEDAEEYDTFFRPQSAPTNTGRIPLCAAKPPAADRANLGPHILSTLTDHLTKTLQGPSPLAISTATTNVGEQLLGKVGWRPPKAPRTDAASLAVFETKHSAPLALAPPTQPRGTFHAVILDSDEDDSPRPASSRLQAPQPIGLSLPQQQSTQNQTALAPSVSHMPCKRCHDGRPPLPGFVLVTERVEWLLDEDTVSTTQVPADFVPGKAILALWRLTEHTPTAQRPPSRHHHKHPQDSQGPTGSHTVAQYLDQQIQAQLVRHADMLATPRIPPSTTIDTRALSQQSTPSHHAATQPPKVPRPATPSPMLARFTRATGEDTNRPALQPGLQHIVPPPPEQASITTVHQSAPSLSTTINIRPLVRTITTFLPHRLLSKRFNLPPVHSNARTGDKRHPTGPTNSTTVSRPPAQVNRVVLRPSVATLDQVVSQEFAQGSKPESVNLWGSDRSKPPTSLFKVVFEDDDSDSDG
ncbi:hypothetical protein H4R34_003401 [Dimargaris verticillata]|uniref:G patch domain-containing protein n=1 Tax=Dimargaris verticillata TaxID=2761393 RepID=A0A9W8ECN8_9FUNG|nr:hypothetical protein H4R34_003401 [Dimargaris verticillata]